MIDNENNYKYDIKMVTRGRCMMCGKDLTEGLFFCKECEDKAKEDIKKHSTKNQCFEMNRQ